MSDNHAPVYPWPPHVHDAEEHLATAHAAGMAETLRLLRADRPGAALRRLAQTVTDELACEGFPGISIHVAHGMTRIHAAKRLREASRQAVAS